MAKRSAIRSDEHLASHQRGVLARPLDSLAFLLPFLLFYEVAILILSSRGGGGFSSRVVAFEWLERFFELFGTTGVLLPGLAVAVVLVATQFASREPWRIHRRTVALMYVEAVAWALPLIAFSHFTRMAAWRLPDQSVLANVALCVGAGIYEELLFRLVLISALVVVGADLLRFSQGTTLACAVLVSAVVFSMHHHPPFGAEAFDAFRFSFRFLAGVYLGVIFVYRGYGPAAGAHIAYNLLVIMPFA
jgi:membrane protease YdiL (CAAX protease family)